MANNFVTVATFTNYIEANLALQRLEAENIRCYLADEAIVAIAWHLTIAVGWIKLQVVQSDVVLAVSILTSTNLDSENIPPELLLPKQEDDLEKLSWADQTVDQAFRAAVIGLFLFILPLQIYSLWLLIRLLVSPRRISHNRLIKVIFALIFNLVNLLVLFTVWSYLY